VGNNVQVGLGVGVKYTVGVQVGGNITEVAVEVGISMVGGNVAGGNGLIDEDGLAKIARTTPKTISAANKTTMERTSHTLSFMLPSHPGVSKIFSFCEYIRLWGSVKHKDRARERTPML
jgi:hypothetical protein